MAEIEIPTIEDYANWAIENSGIQFNPSVKNIYNSNSTTALVAVQENDFFSSFDEFIRELNRIHVEQSNSSLLMAEQSLKLVKKSFESVFNKIYRHNVVFNKKFPAPPHYGLITPENLYSEINDIIRGTIVCKYKDGPGFLAQKLKERATAFGLESDYKSQQRDVGYYAFHFYVKIPVELLNQQNDVFKVDLSVEIQLTTQLQEILYQITHKHYEDLRDKRISGDKDAWKWEIKTNRFRAGYLGHTLHLLEAIIIDLRDGDDSPQEAIILEEDNEQS